MIDISKVFNARVYIDGTDFIAKAEEIDLPKVKFKFSDTKALGLYADGEFPTGLDKLEARIKFNSVYPDFIALAADPFTARTIIIYAPMQDWQQTGVVKTSSVKAEIRGFFKEWDSGKLKKAESAEAEATVSCIYYKLDVDGQDVIEVDTINNIYKIKGKDILQDYKINIGGQ